MSGNPKTYADAHASRFGDDLDSFITLMGESPWGFTASTQEISALLHSVHQGSMGIEQFGSIFTLLSPFLPHTAEQDIIAAFI